LSKQYSGFIYCSAVQKSIDITIFRLALTLVTVQKNHRMVKMKQQFKSIIINFLSKQNRIHYK